MLVGHTHENIDQMFSRFSVKLRTVKAFTLAELMQVARDSFNDKHRPFCSHITAVNDWEGLFKIDRETGKLKDTFQDFDKISKQHVFEIQRDSEDSEEVLLRAKLFSTCPTFKPDQGLQVLPTPLPPGIKPSTQECAPLDKAQKDNLHA